MKLQNLMTKYTSILSLTLQVHFITLFSLFLSKPVKQLELLDKELKR